MHTFSDTARNRSFKRAVKRANIPHPTGGQWGLHSLRHAYGVYLLNYLPVPGGYGLQLKDVQLLMGHKDEKTTKHYAREDRTILASKLEYADACTLGLTLELADLPSFIAARLRHEATKYETGDLK
jgi:integrase